MKESVSNVYDQQILQKTKKIQKMGLGSPRLINSSGFQQKAIIMLTPLI